MFWEPQNASLHHEGEEILLPTVAESECTNCRPVSYTHLDVYKRQTTIHSSTSSVAQMVGQVQTRSSLSWTRQRAYTLVMYM